MTTRENYITSERLHAELTASAGAVRGLRQNDATFQTALDLAVAALVRDPSGAMSHIHRIVSVYGDAVARRAEQDWNERAAA